MADADSVLETLTSIESIRGAAILQKDGTPVASAFPGAGDITHLAAVAASNLGTCEKLGESIDTGPIDSILITGKEGIVFSHYIDSERFVTILAAPDADMDAVREQVLSIVDDLD